MKNSQEITVLLENIVGNLQTQRSACFGSPNMGLAHATVFSSLGEPVS